GCYYTRVNEHPRTTVCRGKGAARYLPPEVSRRMEGSQGSARSGRHGIGVGEGAHPSATAFAPRAHGGIGVYVLSRVGPHNGCRPFVHAINRSPRPVLRRCSSL